MVREKVFLLPTYSYPLDGSPHAKNIMAYARGLSVGFDTMLPVTDVGWPFWLKIDGLELVPMTWLTKSWVIDDLSLPSDMMDLLCGFDPDIVLNFKTTITPFLRGLTSAVIVNAPAFGTRMRQWETPEDWISERAFYLDGGKTLFQLPYDRNVVENHLRKIVSKPLLQRFLINSGYAFNGFDFDWLFECLGKSQAKRGPIPLLVYAGSGQPVKRIDLVTKIMYYVSCMRDVATILNATFNFQAFDEAKRLGLNVTYDKTFDGYVDILKSADVFIFCSAHESWSYTMLEMFAAGVVVALLRAPWMEGLVPDDYPFIFDTVDEMIQGVLWIVDNLEEARRLGDIKDFLLEAYSFENFGRNIVDVVRGIVNA